MEGRITSHRKGVVLEEKAVKEKPSEGEGE